MRVCTLASSSSGNSTLIFTDNTKILIDAGLRLSEIELKLKALNISGGEINAILLTHEHSDHIKGIGPFMRKYGAKLYVHTNAKQTALRKLGKVNENYVIEFFDEPFEVGELQIHAFKLPHDANYCVGYNVSKGDKKVSIVTDLGHVTNEIVEKMHNSRIVILESNHDEKLLMQNPNYSALLKTRILGKNGHLSNSLAGKVVGELAKNNVKQVLLAHLSDENNTPELAYNTICNYLESVNIVPNKHIKIDVASKDKISAVFYLK